MAILLPIGSFAKSHLLFFDECDLSFVMYCHQQNIVDGIDLTGVVQRI
jgi:hypothetical protein